MACKVSALIVLFTACQQVASVKPSFGRVATGNVTVSFGTDVAGDDQGLGGKPLQPCSTEGDESKTGVGRDGSCKWDAADGAYHAVCVKMSDTFLKNSADKDNNDLSSVVKNGGHWCICAWAFASAVTRDPKNIEGLELVCDATNGMLRHVYKTKQELSGPSNKYLTETALKKVDELCGPGSPDDASKPDDAAKSFSSAQGAFAFLFLSLSIHAFSMASSERLEFCLD